MPTLADVQLRFRDVVIPCDTNAVASLASLLTGGRDPEKRLSVHQRNYRQSLVEALLVKFPATGWLMGTSFVMEAAGRFIREQPPAAPCIAEYGAEFPAFLSQHAGAEPVPYLRDFTELEWHVGQVAIAVDDTLLTLEQFSGIDPDTLPNTLLTLQPGLRFVQAAWPVDELMKLYLTETAPHRLELSPDDVWIEVRGARGEFHISRLDAAEFMFRKCIFEGRSIGDAAESTLDVHPAFDPGQALAALIAVGSVTGIAERFA